MLFTESSITWIFLFLLLLGTLTFILTRQRRCTEPPGPRRWPIIGSLPYLLKHSSTATCFDALAKEYGDIVTFKLGSVSSIVVSGLENIQQVLLTRQDEFDSRPGFLKFNLLFNGDRNNSLAFADWSENHRKRREIVSYHTFPKIGSPGFEVFQQIATEEIAKMILKIKSTQNGNKPHFLKQDFIEVTLKIFLKYFSNLEISNDIHQEFQELGKVFDERLRIFMDVNWPSPVDMFPSLKRIYRKSHLTKYGKLIQSFLKKYCVDPKRTGMIKKNECDKVDLLDDILSRLDDIGEDSGIHAFDDAIGGHSEVANVLTCVFNFIAQNSGVQNKIREEISSREKILLTDDVPYIESVFWESLRLLSSVGSTLIPYVAKRDTTLGGFEVKKDTVIFLNNGELNISTKYWTDPEKFEPERFLKDGQFLKPDHFFPFGNGHRSCLGYQLSIYLSILIISELCRNFEIRQGSSPFDMVKGFGFVLQPRENSSSQHST